MRYQRFLLNDQIDQATYYLPYTTASLNNLHESSLILIIDTRQVGRRCLVLMVSFLYQQWAIPIC